MEMTRKTGCRPVHRRGTVIFVVLVFIVVATIVVSGTVQTSIHFRRQLSNELRVEQARWLLDGGVRMALAKRRLVPDYNGGRIELDDELSPLETGLVTVRFAPLQDDDNQIRLNVTAEVNRGRADPARPRQSVTPERRPPRAHGVRRSIEITVSASDET